MTRTRPFALLTAVILAAGFAAGGCHQNPKTTRKTAAKPKPPAPPTRISEIDLRAYKPNEAGAVMVIMYHHINPKKPNNDMNRTPDQFRKDLQTLYDKGYRPVTLREFAENNMDVPAGKTPVVLTFDDSYISQFRYTDPAGSVIDPNCAVGIMEEFSRQHPDWKPKATFFVLHGGKNPPAFYQHGMTAQKFAYLLELGCEIGSHSLSHGNFRRMTPQRIMQEVAGSIKAIQEECPDAKITSLAVPYGNAPRDPAALQACISGKADGVEYRLSAVVMAAWRPTLAPITKRNLKTPFAGQVAAGNPYHIERIVPHPGKASTAGTLEYYLKFFDQNPALRYVSDGNPRVVAVPQGMASLVDEKIVKSMGKRLQVYSLTPQPKQKGAAGNLGAQ